MLLRPEQSGDILVRLWNREQVESIHEYTSRSDGGKGLNNLPYMAAQQSSSLDDISRRLANKSPQGSIRASNQISYDQLRMYNDNRPKSSPLEKPTTMNDRSWTKIACDASLMEHLLALYFCWEYPTFASLSKEHYLRDFHSGRNRYCSSLLTNALLALGCHFSMQIEPWEGPGTPLDSGENFFTEGQRLYSQEKNHHSLTTIQALGIMSLREASCGRMSNSGYYAGQCMRLAIEMDLHKTRYFEKQSQEDQDEFTVRLATFWGAFALDKLVINAFVTRHIFQRY